MRLALRIARRGIRRNLGRSLLIAVLVGVPVAGATMVDVLARTLSAPERDAQRHVGAADAQVTVAPQRTLPGFRPTAFVDVGHDAEPERDARAVDVAALLPAGARVVPAPFEVPLRLSNGDRIVRTSLRAADVREPLHRHEGRVVDGRAPARPDEALLSSPLAERLGIGPGGTVTAAEEGATLRVVGVAQTPFCHSCEQVVVLPGSALAKQAADAEEPPQARYLVDLPPGTNADALWPALARKGVALVPREAYSHPERYEPPGGVTAGTDDLQAIALTVVIAGLGLLEVVLLAGTAFAVGARRQTRELGLVSASGGSARHVRRIVLAQGLVLGVLGAALGVAVGAALVIGARPLWEHFADGDITGWKFGPWEIAGAALIGLLSGLAAAIIPAIGAGRMHAVDALAERFRTTRSQRRRSALLGGGLIAAGAVCGLAGDRLLAGDFALYARALARVQETGTYVAQPTSAGPLALIVGGATLLVAGLVFLAPALIGRLAGLGARLPLSARLAVRDASRHRHRTGPATSAIAVAVAGSVVLAFLLAGSFRADELQHVPSLPAHVLAVEPGDAAPDAAVSGARLAAAELPGARVHELRRPMRALAKGEALPPDLPETDVRQIYPVQQSQQLNCALGCETSGGSLAVAGDDELNAIAAGG
jgi:putative ABC transport system permease protein